MGEKYMAKSASETPPTQTFAELKRPPLNIPPVELGSPSNVPARNASVDKFLKREAEVLERDRAEFKTYLVAKHEEATRKAKAAEAAKLKTKPRVSRRTMLNAAVGTVAAAEVAVLGYN